MEDIEQQRPPSNNELPSEQREKLPPQEFDQDNSSATDVGDTPAKALYPETDLSRGIIGWDGQNDPANPQNFAKTRKYGLLGLVSAMTLVSPLASSMFAPAVGYMAEDFHVTNETLLSFSVSIYLLGYTVRYFTGAPQIVSNDHVY